VSVVCGNELDLWYLDQQLFEGIQHGGFANSSISKNNQFESTPLFTLENQLFEK
jgi:hypothetical protein